MFHMMLTGMTFPKCISVCVGNLTCGLYVFITCLLVCAGKFLIKLQVDVLVLQCQC